MRRIRLMTGFVLCLVAAGAAVVVAQMPERVRGTLQAIEGDTLRVATRGGETLDFRLKQDAGIFVVTPAGLADIEQGDFIGITSIESGGRRVALEAHLFADDLRGTGEGHYAWDLVQEPNMMTNASIAEIKEVGEERELTLTYKEGEGDQARKGTQTIYLPPEIPIVLIEKAGRDALVAGKDIFAMVENEGGERIAVAAVVGEEGASPPM